MKKIVTVTLNPAIDTTYTVDSFLPGGLNRVCSKQKDAGGKGINCAKVLQSFPVSVLTTGVLPLEGKAFMEEAMAKEGVVGNFYQVPGAVRTNHKIVDSRTGVTTELNEAGFSVTEAEKKECLCYIEERLTDASVMILSGSAAKGFSPSVYGELIQKGHNRGVKTILDADGEALLMGVKAVPYAVKPNRAELEGLFGPIHSRDDLIVCGKKLLSQGISLVCISLGAEGALFLTEKAGYYARALSVPCSSTVGAGDSMVAAMAYGISQDYALEEIIQLAMKASLVTVQKPGSTVCSLEEIKAFPHEIATEKIW